MPWSTRCEEACVLDWTPQMRRCTQRQGPEKQARFTMLRKCAETLRDHTKNQRQPGPKPSNMFEACMGMCLNGHTPKRAVFPSTQPPKKATLKTTPVDMISQRRFEAHPMFQIADLWRQLSLSHGKNYMKSWYLWVCLLITPVRGSFKGEPKRETTYVTHP